VSILDALLEKKPSIRTSSSTALVLLLISLSISQNLYYENVYGDSSPSYPISIKDFTLKYEYGPTFGKIVAGKPLVVSTILQNDFNIQANATYFIEVLDKKGLVESLQSKVVDISNRAPFEILVSWTPNVLGSHTITGFIWLMNNNNTAIALAPKTSIDVDVQQESTVKTYTLCADRCDYSDFQKAIDRLHKLENRILVEDGNYELFRPIRVWSHTNLEFSANAQITYLGPENTTVFYGNQVSDIEIVNAQITAIARSGMKAFSFTSSTGINISGGQVTLIKGEESAGLYCRDCKNVAIVGLRISNASRLVDIGTISQTNDNKSSAIWILNGNYESSSIEGIKVNYSNDVHIIGNRVSNTSDNAIDIGHNSHSIVMNNRVENGGVPHGSGIHTDSSIRADIFGNVLKVTGGQGITVYRASEINIINNTITNAGSVGVAIISADEPSSNINVRYNYIIDSFDSWIYVSANQKNIELSDNIFH